MAVDVDVMLPCPLALPLLDARTICGPEVWACPEKPDMNNLQKIDCDLP
jgi:hypothetical protein